MTYATRFEPIPRDLAGVTPEWLTRTLQLRYPALVVHGFEEIGLKNSHTTKLRVRLDLNAAGRDAGIPETVCLKANWSGFPSNDICALEAKFYRDFRERFDLPAPRAWFADWEADDSQGVVMMEDLEADGGRFGHSTDHMGVDAAAAALETLARLHGAFWNSPELTGSPWLQTSMQTPVDHAQLRMMYGFVETNAPKPEYQAILPDWIKQDPDRFHRAYDALVAHARAARGPLCLVHGDSHQGNSFIRAGGERIWIDWQLVRRGHPWRDFTYFLVGALTVEERRANDRNLLTHYLAALKATGASDVLSLEEAWEQYRRWPVYGQQAWLANMDEWGQKGVHICERFFTAGEDLGTLDALGV